MRIIAWLFAAAMMLDGSSGSVRRRTRIGAYIGDGRSDPSTVWDAQAPGLGRYLTGIQIYDQIVTYNFTNVMQQIHLGHYVTWVIELMETNGYADPGNLAGIIAGQYDAQLYSLVADVESFEREIRVRIFHEGNGNWYPWAVFTRGNSAALFVEAFRHVSGILRRTDLIQIEFGLNDNSADGNVVPWSAFAPGDYYFDAACLSCYNRAGLDQWDTQWLSFDAVCSPAYDRMLSITEEPLCIGEMSSVPSNPANDGWNKTAWIRDAWDTLVGMTRIHHVNWFLLNGYDAAWALNTPGETEAWIRGVARFKNATRVTWAAYSTLQ